VKQTRGGRQSALAAPFAAAAVLLLAVGSACVDRYPESTDPLLPLDGGAPDALPPGANCETEPGFEAPEITVPRFIDTLHIELDKIGQISTFRSAAGHDFNDTFELCRNMKHYFVPESGVDGGSIRIVSPVSGTIIDTKEESFGWRVQISTDEQPDVHVVLFHVDLAAPLERDDPVSEGQVLGTHWSGETNSDVAVGVLIPGGWRLISYFDVITDDLFSQYQARGIVERDQMVISEDERDADALCCVGDQFATSSQLTDWILLD